MQLQLIVTPLANGETETFYSGLATLGASKQKKQKTSGNLKSQTQLSRLVRTTHSYH
jgi:hypothetical protein